AEFVCSTPALGCNVGAFDPSRGPRCFFPWAGAERGSAEFRLLLNPGGFEALDWADASFGSAPAGAVRGCERRDVLVGRGPAGLGKASREHRALFAAVEGEEVWYKWYQVLAVRQGAGDVAISDVSYNGSAAVESGEPAVLV
ncbi:NATT4 protein, partial [Sylvietta virens]|nr:NATT4 protein [Sylvietta virens]